MGSTQKTDSSPSKTEEYEYYIGLRQFLKLSQKRYKPNFQYEPVKLSADPPLFFKGKV